MSAAAPDVLPQPARRSRPSHGYAFGKDDYLRRLRKVEG